MTLDHLFVAAFVVLYPLAGLLGFRRLMRRIAGGHPVDRAHVYRNTILGHWALLVLGLLLWSSAGRPWAAMGVQGVGHPGWPVAVAWGFVAVVVTVLVRQLRELARTSDDEISGLHARLGTLDAVVPRTPDELRHFYAVSVTAGIVEEALWRGYLLWYLLRYMPLGMAALVATLAFGVAHAYQGWRQVPAITAVGAALTGLYLLTGTLWASIALHIAIDVLQGRLGYEIIRRRSPRR